MKYANVQEQEIKNKVAQDVFGSFDCSAVIGNIDFCVSPVKTEKEQNILFDPDEEQKLLQSILWAEAKRGVAHDIYESFVQLILTIGKEKTFEKYLPPKYIGAFDAEKIAFIEYNKIQHIFFQNDFNWNVTPSNHGTKEFKQLFDLSKSLIEENSMLFYYEKHRSELKAFIKANFRTGKDITEKIKVTKNNFTFVFQRWLADVKPTIAVDWEEAKKDDIISADFFLADLLSEDNRSLKDNLFVLLKSTEYFYNKERKRIGGFRFDTVGFSDGQAAHRAFWAIYERPPREEYWDEIIARRDLLVPQDIRERKGSFFTPQIWVEKSQEYLAAVLGENWQSEYYIWDCAAGTGNLLNGLTNYRNVWASTVDKADVDVMRDRIENGWSMFDNHVFQFDFLNDDFDKCPDELREILSDAEKRKHLIVYINPPYAEAGTGTGRSKAGITNTSKVYQKYKPLIGKAAKELYALFFIRIFAEISGCVLGCFSKLKVFQASNFQDFRNAFKANLEKMFIVPATTFDNVTGQFPIGFFVWNCGSAPTNSEIVADVFDMKGNVLPQKTIFFDYARTLKINDWLKTFSSTEQEKIGVLMADAPDFANQKYICVLSEKTNRHGIFFEIDKGNLLQSCVYFAVRLCIKPIWYNDREQFLFPNDAWQADRDFQLDCLIYTLFHGQNRISAEQRENYWIPFTEREVGCKRAFKSVFMSDFLRDFMAGDATTLTERKDSDTLFEQSGSNNAAIDNGAVRFSPEAQAVYDAGRELWRYYHAQDGAVADASFYDIRRYFQGTDDKGRMKNGSTDAQYTALIAALREKQKALAARIDTKVYEYGFLR